MKFIKLENGEMLSTAAVRSFKSGTRNTSKTVNTPGWGKEDVVTGTESTLSIETMDGKTYWLYGAPAEAAQKVLPAAG